MEAKYKAYDHVRSDARIQDILDNAAPFDDATCVPARSQLTYKNGFYVPCTAVFIDIRGSSKLLEDHNRPVLGKIYRAYLSECVAVMNGNPKCREVFIRGDCVGAIFDTPLQDDVNSVFETAMTLNSVVRILNWRLERKGYKTILCGVGVDSGRALMLKAGYSGSGISDVIWMGDVVNGASKLCHQGNRDGAAAVQVSKTVYERLADEHKKQLSSPAIFFHTRYEGDVTDPGLEAWLMEQQAAAKNAAASRKGLSWL